MRCRTSYVFDSPGLRSGAISRLDAVPASWADFWDVKRFSGPRGLRNNPRGTLEIALLADGISAEKLYPLNLDRAFAKLDELRPHLYLVVGRPNQYNYSPIRQLS